MPHDAIRSPTYWKYWNQSRDARREGRIAEARLLCEKVIALAEVQANSDDRDVECREALAYTYHDLGKAARKDADFNSAASFFAQELRVAKELAAIDQGYSGLLSRTFESLANLALKGNHILEAARLLEEMSAYLARPGGALTAYAASISYDSLARLAAFTGAFDRARLMGDESISLRRQLAHKHPRWERALAVAFDDMAIIALGQGQLEEAWALSTHALRVVRTLLETADPEGYDSDSPEDSIQKRFGIDSFECYQLLSDASIISGNLADIAKVQGDKMLSETCHAAQLSIDRIWQEILLDRDEITGFAEVVAALHGAEDRTSDLGKAPQVDDRYRADFLETYHRLGIRAVALGHGALAQELRRWAGDVE